MAAAAVGHETQHAIAAPDFNGKLENRFDDIDAEAFDGARLRAVSGDAEGVRSDRRLRRGQGLGDRLGA